MRFARAITGAVVLGIGREASIISPQHLGSSAPLEQRATPVAPNGYTPEGGDCPSTKPSIRPASGLSQQETDWLESRRKQTEPALQTLLKRLDISGFDVDSYFSKYSNDTSSVSNVGIAVSGGGWRACLNGAGAIQAFDSREANTTSTGQLGGLLDSATYLAGLSGGGWLVGSIFVNNYTTISNLLSSSSVWQFQNSIIAGPDSSILSTADYYGNLYSSVHGKSDADFETTLTDYWGRAVSYQLVNASDGGVDLTWSSIANDTDFAASNTPLPILVADERAPGELLIAGNTTVYEYSPWEFGSWDPTTFGFAPLQYLGSNFTNGELTDDDTCVRGFDNVGLVMGTSSSLFNAILLEANITGVPSIFQGAIEGLLNDVGSSNEDIASYSPNPFYGYNTDTNVNGNETTLTMVDGGEDLENIPFHPLIQPSRGLDVIFAVDSSADTVSHWPNGTSLVATYERSLNDIANGTAFPFIPDVNTMVNLGLNARPTFFGCNASNYTTTTAPGPLVVYIPNSPYVYTSNVSTFQLSYNISERDAIVQNGYYVATRGNSSQWGMCVGCAILARSFERTGTPVPDVCGTCMRTYCWDGTLNATVPTEYEPELNALGYAINVSNSSESGAASGTTRSIRSSIGLGMVWGVGFFIMFLCLL
ncbi:Lysophospholipase 1 [Agyrium rufum]|nr:Lysophospholipase 1 [Agyrium rufum]